MVGHYGVKEGSDPLPRFNDDNLLAQIANTMTDLSSGFDKLGHEIYDPKPYQHMLETQMVSLCLRVDKLLDKEET